MRDFLIVSQRMGMERIKKDWEMVMRMKPYFSEGKDSRSQRLNGVLSIRGRDEESTSFDGSSFTVLSAIFCASGDAMCSMIIFPSAMGAV